MAIVTGEAPLQIRGGHHYFDSNPAVFYIEGLVFEIDLNSTCTGVLEAIGQELLDDDQKPLAIGNDGDIQIMQVHCQVLLDKKEGIFADHFFDQVPLATRALRPDHHENSLVAGTAEPDWHRSQS